MLKATVGHQTAKKSNRTDRLLAVRALVNSNHSAGA